MSVPAVVVCALRRPLVAHPVVLESLLQTSVIGEMLNLAAKTAKLATPIGASLLAKDIVRY
jgi:hypothetical protein